LAGGTQVVFPRADRTWRRIATRRELLSRGHTSSAPVNPTALADGASIAVDPALLGPAFDDPALVGWARVDPAPLGPAFVGPAATGPAFTGPALTGPALTGPVSIPLLPGERTTLRLFQFGLANGCTVASLLLGMSAVFLAIHGDLRLAAIALLACVVFDGCDGGLARKFNVASPFGAQMDSLADLSSFGVASGIVMYQWLVAQGAQPIAAAPACALLAVCAAIRLARFNVSPKDGRYFCGVPTTMTAAVLALDMLLGPNLPVSVQVAAVAVSAIAMVTSFPYAKLVRVLRLPLWLWVFPAICAMISVPGTFVAIVGAYLVSGPLLWLYLHQRRPALFRH
jgi:CDP-diacylglycerol--serine O-phosphatidyltransferase